MCGIVCSPVTQRIIIILLYSFTDFMKHSLWQQNCMNLKENELFCLTTVEWIRWDGLSMMERQSRDLHSWFKCFQILASDNSSLVKQVTDPAATIHFVSLAFRRKGFLSGHSTKLLTSFLYSDSCPPLMHPTTAVPSKNLCRCHVSLLYWLLFIGSLMTDPEDRHPLLKIRLKIFHLLQAYIYI